MTDNEKRAHDLAIAFIQAYPPKVDDNDWADREYCLLNFAACYEEAYGYFKNKLQKD